MNNQTKYLIALTHFKEFGLKSLEKITKHFLNLEQGFNASPDQLIKAGIREKNAQKFINWRADFNLEKALKLMEEENIQVIALTDSEYPTLLKEIIDPPQILYYKGDLNCLDFPSLSIVGSRKFSSYGKRIVDDFIPILVESRLTITSGLALGIDALAHWATLKNQGRTIAVLGSGVDNNSLYPASNKILAQRILENKGLILSEFAPGTEPLQFNFPQRNRIIAGLSLGSLIIEAGDRSGSLITAYSALESGREVFAVPGNIYSPNSIGTNKLLKKGANLVVCAQDILESLNLKTAINTLENKKNLPSSEDEIKILTILKKDNLHINEIIRFSGLDAPKVNSLLVIMEMKGLIKNLGGMMFAL